MAKGVLIVISAPSGAGKQTVIRRLREQGHRISSTISATTRAPRRGEVDGKDYGFLSMEAFKEHIASGDFVEWAEVHENLYGTLRGELERCLDSGEDVILELDVQGMRNLRALRSDVVSVFVAPPSMEELERRLRSRGTDDDEVIALRLRNAELEMAVRREFDYIIVNDSVARAADDLAAVLRAEACRAHRQP